MESVKKMKTDTDNADNMDGDALNHDVDMADTNVSPISRQQVLPTLPEGILFVALMNGRHRYFVPFTDCEFEGVQVSECMIDTGCNSHLLPLKKDELIQLSKKFDKINYQWSIVTSDGVGGVSLTLKIKKTMGDMTAIICGNPFQIEFLRFHLCHDDIVLLLKEEKSRFGREDLKILKEKYDMNHIFKRRTHALLGQVFYDKYLLLQFGGLCIIANEKLNTSMENLKRIASELTIVIKDALPKIFPKFNDLEDDDHNGDCENTDFVFFDEYLGDRCLFRELFLNTA